MNREDGMHGTIIIIDYFLQFVERGTAADEALALAKTRLYTTYRERMKREEYLATIELLERIAASM